MKSWPTLETVIQSIQAGKSFKCDERPPKEGEIGVAKVSSLSWGSYNEDESKTCRRPELVNPDLYIKKDDFLFSRANTIELVGACVIVGVASKNIMLSDKTLRINFAEGNPHFFLYYLKSHIGRSEIERLATGNQDSMRNIGQNRIKSIRFPPVTPEQQHRIVEKIEALFAELDRGVEALKSTQQQLKVYRQSVLKHAFEGKLTEQWRKTNPDKVGNAKDLLQQIQQEREQRYQQQLSDWQEAVEDWETSGSEGKKPRKPKLISVDLGKVVRDALVAPGQWLQMGVAEIAVTLDQGWSPRCENKPTEGDYCGVIKTSAIQPGRFEAGQNKQLPDDLSLRADLSLVAGDILITRAGPRNRVGVTALVRKSYPNLMICDKVYRLRLPVASVKPEFFEYAMNTGEFVQKIEELKSGINDSGLNLTQDRFGLLMIPVPSPAEQTQIIQEIESRLSVIDQLEKTIEQSLQKSEALRQSILKKAFAGELVPQDH